MEPTPDPSDKYPLHTAARNGALRTVESLIVGNPKLVSKPDEDSRLPLHWACVTNQLEVVRALAERRNFDEVVDAQDSSGWTPLMISSSLKADEGLPVLELLLGKEAEVKVQSNTGGTALHFAVSKGNLEVVRRLLGAGASARVKDKRGQLPLHRAAAVGNIPLVKALIAAKSPLNATDSDGMTPLHQAISEGHGDVAVELLKSGAESDKRDIDDRLALDCAPDSSVRVYILRAAEVEGIDVAGG